LTGELQAQKYAAMGPLFAADCDQFQYIRDFHPQNKVEKNVF
jgi:hypothetical protein